jgi:hypothetical protein
MTEPSTDDISGMLPRRPSAITPQNTGTSQSNPTRDRRPPAASSSFVGAAAVSAASLQLSAANSAIVSNSIHKKKSKKKHGPVDWPTDSADSLPKLSSYLKHRLQENTLEFPINEECKYVVVCECISLLAVI